MRTFREFREFHSTLEYHDKLNPKLWNYAQLDPVIRTHLLAIAYEWQQSAHITADMVRDIIITGGNCNFNYTEASDIDVHIIVDMSKMPIKDEELLVDYMKSKKDLWAAKHKDVNIKGYPVELYAQDIKVPFPKDQGVFSILYNKWLVEPLYHEDMSYDKAEFIQKVQSFIHRINVAIRDRAPIADADALWDEMTKVRGAAIQKDGEFASDNLVFKELRNRGYIQKMRNYIEKHKSAELSLD